MLKLQNNRWKLRVRRTVHTQRRSPVQMDRKNKKEKETIATPSQYSAEISVLLPWIWSRKISLRFFESLKEWEMKLRRCSSNTVAHESGRILTAAVNYGLEMKIGGLLSLLVRGPYIISFLTFSLSKPKLIIICPYFY